MTKKASSNFVRNEARSSKPRRPFFTDAPSPLARDVSASGRGPRNDVESASKFTSNLVEEPPVGCIRDNLRRIRFQHPRFAQTKRVKADGVFGIKLAPAVVRHVRKRLSRIVVARRETPIYHTLRNKGRRAYAQIRRPEHGANYTFGGDGILSDELTIPRQHAAIILRPWAILRTVDDDMTDVLRTQTLWLRREAKERVDLTLSKQFDRFDLRARHPLDILGGIESDKTRHRADENVRTTAKPLLADGSPLQISNATNALLGE